MNKSPDHAMGQRQYDESRARAANALARDRRSRLDYLFRQQIDLATRHVQQALRIQHPAGFLKAPQ